MSSCATAAHTHFPNAEDEDVLVVEEPSDSLFLSLLLALPRLGRRAK